MRGAQVVGRLVIECPSCGMTLLARKLTLRQCERAARGFEIAHNATSCDYEQGAERMEWQQADGSAEPAEQPWPEVEAPLT